MSTGYYPWPIHLQPIYKSLGYAKGTGPEAERACKEAFAADLSRTDQATKCIGWQKMSLQRYASKVAGRDVSGTKSSEGIGGGGEANSLGSIFPVGAKNG